MKERAQRLALFSAIEGGASFWSREISERGVQSVFDRIKADAYDSIKHAALVEKVKSFESAPAFQSIEKAGSHFIIPGDAQWPLRVDELECPPIGLIVKGNVETLSNPSLAIVGTRNPTPYGTRIAGDFAAGFVDREWDIVSGGAYGVDSAAHRGALVAEGRTIAVIASGIDLQEHRPDTVHMLFNVVCALLAAALAGAFTWILMRGREATRTAELNAARGDHHRITAELAAAPACFYILTNSRSLTAAASRALHLELATHLRSASRATGRPFVIASRSDSTLRGYYPLETDTLSSVLGPFDATLLTPYFEAGGRYTLNDTHYVAEGDRLVPAADTPLARDAVFGYRTSHLPSWVEEKTAGRTRASAARGRHHRHPRGAGPRVRHHAGGGRPCLAAAAGATGRADWGGPAGGFFGRLGGQRGGLGAGALGL